MTKPRHVTPVFGQGSIPGRPCMVPLACCLPVVTRAYAACICSGPHAFDGPPPSPHNLYDFISPTHLIPAFEAFAQSISFHGRPIVVVSMLDGCSHRRQVQSCHIIEAWETPTSCQRLSHSFRCCSIQPSVSLTFCVRRVERCSQDLQVHMAYTAQQLCATTTTSSPSSLF